MRIIKRNRFYINIGATGQFYLSLKNGERKEFDFGYPNTSISFGSDYEAGADSGAYMGSADSLEYIESSETDNGYKIGYNL